MFKSTNQLYLLSIKVIKKKKKKLVSCPVHLTVGLVSIEHFVESDLSGTPSYPNLMDLEVIVTELSLKALLHNLFHIVRQKRNNTTWRQNIVII